MPLHPDPDEQNPERATYAGHAIKTFREQTGSDSGDAVADLLCDLAHYCDFQGFDFEAELKRASEHYLAETGAQGEQLRFMRPTGELCD